MGKTKKKQGQCPLERMPAGSPGMPKMLEVEECTNDPPFTGIERTDLHAELLHEKEVADALDELFVQKEIKYEEVSAECHALKEELSYKGRMLDESMRKCNDLESLLDESISAREDASHGFRECTVECNKLKTLLHEAEGAREEAIRKCAGYEVFLEEESGRRLEAEDRAARYRANLDGTASKLDALKLQLSIEREASRSNMEKHAADMERLGEIAKDSVAQWYWSGSGEHWHAFDMAANPEVERAHSRFQNGSGCSTLEIQSGAHSYMIDFDAMIQTNQATGTERNIRRREFGVHNTDPVKVVQLVLTSRSQEAEALQVNLAKTRRESDAASNKVASLEQQFDQLQQTCQDQLDENATLESALKTASKDKKLCQASLVEARAALAAIKKEMQDKDDGVAKNITELHRAQQDTNEKLNEVTVKLRSTQDELDATRNARNTSDASCNTLTTRLAGVTAKLAESQRKQAEVNLSCGKRIRDIAEIWKTSSPDLFKVEECPTMMDKVSCLLKSLSHTNRVHNGSPSRCHVFQQVRIRSVHSLHNPHIWSKYTRCRQDLKMQHEKAHIEPQPLSVQALEPLFEGVKLEASVNEVFLAHGCDENAAAEIVNTGFDIRFTNTNGGSLYGEGMYFTTEPCKCHQYTNVQASQVGHIIIARVLMGDPCFLKAQYTGRVPPPRDTCNPQHGRFDSNVVDPQVSTRGQAHWEYVVFDGSQAYPEMLITYEIP